MPKNNITMSFYIGGDRLSKLMKSKTPLIINATIFCPECKTLQQAIMDYPHGTPFLKCNGCNKKWPIEFSGDSKRKITDLIENLIEGKASGGEGKASVGRITLQPQPCIKDGVLLETQVSKDKGEVLNLRVRSSGSMNSFGTRK